MATDGKTKGAAKKAGGKGAKQRAPKHGAAK